MTMEDWALSDAQRQETVQRVANNISGMAFFKNAPIADDVVTAAAAAIERKAYTVARVEARTTTGVRPHHETLKAYIRKLSALALEVVQTGGAMEGAGPGAKAQGEVDLTGSREFVTRESAEELLAAMLAPGAKITKIRFSTKSFGVEAAEVAARAIENVAGSLVEADMSDIIAGRPEHEALGALRIISAALGKARLRHLNLSDNALGEKGIRACAAAFAEQEALESIAFQNVGCSVHGCAAVDELMANPQHLRRLHLYNNMSGDEGAASIARLLSRCPAMEDFKMVSSRVGAEGGIALAKGLAAAVGLVRLDLHDNPITSEFADDLAAVLAHQTKLRALILNDTSLGDDGVATVCQALAHGAPDLEELELALNEITAEGARAVAACLGAKPGLRRLNLRENELEDEGAVVVARALVSLRSLEHLDACGNQLRRGGACALAKACARMAGLQLLALDENEISEAGLDALREIMAKIGKSEVLGSLEENMADEDDEEDEGAGDDGIDIDDAAGDDLAAAMGAAHI